MRRPSLSLALCCLALPALAQNAPASAPAEPPGVPEPAAPVAAPLPSSAPEAPPPGETPVSAPAAPPVDAPPPVVAPSAVPAVPPAPPAQPAPPAEPRVVEKPKPAPTDCPAVEGADYGAFGIVRDFFWLPDGSAILYLLSSEGPPQLWMVAVPAGNDPDFKPRPRRLTALRDGVLNAVPETGGGAVYLTVPDARGGTRILRLPLPASEDRAPPPAVEPPFSAEAPRSLTALGTARGSLIFLSELADGTRHLHRAVDATGFTELATLATGERPRLVTPRGEVLTVSAAPPALALYDGESGRRRDFPVKFPAPVSSLTPLGFGADGRLLLLADPGGSRGLYGVAPAGGVATPEGAGEPLAAGAIGGRGWEIRAAAEGPILSLAAGDEIPRLIPLPAGGPRRAAPSPVAPRFAAVDDGPLAPGDLWLLPVEGAPQRLARMQPAGVSPVCARAPEAVSLSLPDGPVAGWLWRPAREPRGAAVILGEPHDGYPPFDSRAHYLASRGFLVLRVSRAPDPASLNGPLREWLLEQGAPAFRLVLWGVGAGADAALAAASAAGPDAWGAVVAVAPPLAAGAPPPARLPPLILFAGRDGGSEAARDFAGRLLMSGRPFSYHECSGAGPDWRDGRDRRSLLSLAGKFLRRRVLMKAAPKAPPPSP